MPTYVLGSAVQMTDDQEKLGDSWEWFPHVLKSAGLGRSQKARIKHNIYPAKDLSLLDALHTAGVDDDSIDDWEIAYIYFY